MTVAAALIYWVIVTLWAAAMVEGEKLNLTVSIGVADASIRTAGIETLFRSADQALYDAKRTGRNRVAVASTPAERFALAAE
jgi:diguanylate cyclase (GGDEF)-like protein